jgi:hypothetical protein
MKYRSTITLKIIFYASILLTVIAIIIILQHKKESIEPPKIVENYTGCDHVKYANVPIEPSNVIHDLNEVQLVHAKKNGLKQPIKTNQEFDSVISSLIKTHTLIEVKDCRLYHLKSLKHSHPYLIPEAVCMLDEIAIRFQKKLEEKKLGKYCFFLTSLLRTEETQQKLSHRNGNATDTSAHFYGTTIDISYKHFYNLKTDSIEPSWEVIQELTKTLLEMRKECKLMAVRERKQSCFHITVVVCRPLEERNTSNIINSYEKQLAITNKNRK